MVLANSIVAKMLKGFGIFGTGYACHMNISKSIQFRFHDLVYESNLDSITFNLQITQNNRQRIKLIHVHLIENADHQRSFLKSSIAMIEKNETIISRVCEQIHFWEKNTNSTCLLGCVLKSRSSYFFISIKFYQTVTLSL